MTQENKILYTSNYVHFYKKWAYDKMRVMFSLLVSIVYHMLK